MGLEANIDTKTSGYQVRTDIFNRTNTKGQKPAEILGDAVLSKQISIFDADLIVTEQLEKSLKSGNKEQASHLATLKAYFDPIAQSACLIKDEKEREEYIRKCLDSNGDEKFNMDDVKKVDTDGNGLVNKDEMSEFLETNMGVTSNKPKDRFCREGIERVAIGSNSVFDKEGNLVDGVFKVKD